MKTIEELGISPAPWTAADDDGLTAYVNDGNQSELTQSCYTSEDARLIAAAPELYECLQTLWEFYDHENWGETLEARIKAALEKVGGKNEQR